MVNAASTHAHKARVCLLTKTKMNWNSDSKRKTYLFNEKIVPSEIKSLWITRQISVGNLQPGGLWNNFVILQDVVIFVERSVITAPTTAQKAEGKSAIWAVDIREYDLCCIERTMRDAASCTRLRITKQKEFVPLIRFTIANLTDWIFKKLKTRWQHCFDKHDVRLSLIILEWDRVCWIACQRVER